MVSNICILKEWHFSSFRGSPWTHTHDEWAEIDKSSSSSVNFEPRSLEVEYLHIVKAFLVLMRTLDGQNYPLNYPLRGSNIN